MNTGLSILFYFCIFALLVCSFLMYHCKKAGGSKFYCKVFERSSWNGWEKVIKNFDNLYFEGHHVYEDSPEANCYAFDIEIDNVECRMNYWEKTGDVSVHYVPGIEQGCLSSFDEYHQEVVKKMLCEKFDFMKEVIYGE